MLALVRHNLTTRHSTYINDLGLLSMSAKRTRGRKTRHHRFVVPPSGGLWRWSDGHDRMDIRSAYPPRQASPSDGLFPAGDARHRDRALLTSGAGRGPLFALTVNENPSTLWHGDDVARTVIGRGAGATRSLERTRGVDEQHAGPLQSPDRNSRLQRRNHVKRVGSQEVFEKVGCGLSGRHVGISF